MAASYPRQYRHLILALFAYVAWATTWPVGKVAMSYWTPLGMIAARFLIAGLLLSIVGWAMGTRPKLPGFSEIVVGIFQFNLYFLFSYLALSTGDASTTAVIAGAYPAAVLAGRPRLALKNPGAVLALLVTLAGCFLVGFGQWRQNATLAGTVFAGLAALSMAVSTLTSRPRGGMSLPEVCRFVGSAMIVGAGIALISILLVSGGGLRTSMNFATVGTLAWLSLVGSALVFVAIEWLLRRHAEWKISLGYSIVPGLAALMGILFLGEYPSAIVAAGHTLSVLGIAVAVAVGTFSRS